MLVMAYATSEKDLDKLMRNNTAHKYFRDHLDKDCPRSEWAKVMLYAQKCKINGEPFMVKVSTLEGLKTTNEKAFNLLIQEVIKAGGLLQSIEDEVLFSKEHPQGISMTGKEEHLEKVMQSLRKTWQGKENKANTATKARPGIEITDPLIRKTVEQKRKNYTI